MFRRRPMRERRMLLSAPVLIVVVCVRVDNSARWIIVQVRLTRAMQHGLLEGLTYGLGAFYWGDVTGILVKPLRRGVCSKSNSFRKAASTMVKQSILVSLSS